MTSYWQADSTTDFLRDTFPPDGEQNGSRELGVSPKFHSKKFLKIQEYPSVDDFEGKKRPHGV